MIDNRKLWTSIIAMLTFMFLFVQCFHMWDLTPYYSVKALSVLMGFVFSQSAIIQLITIGDMLDERQVRQGK